MKFLSAILLSTFLVFSNAYAAKKGISISVELSPAGSFEIKGKVKGKVKKSGAGFSAKKLSFKVKRLKTGMDLRDKHTKEKLEYKKYADVVVTDAKGSGGKGTGTINVRGKKQKFNFSYKEVGKYVQAKFKLSLKSFGFSGINYMGVGVKDKVTVTATIPVE
jgi:hypothetical protein